MKIYGYILGYKGNDVYVFFTEDEISVYKVIEEYSSTEFAKLMSELLEDKNIKKFVGSVTDIWPDYDYYEYDSNYVYLRYALKGIEIKFNVSANHGVTVYSNYTGQVTNDVNITDLINKEKETPSGIYLELGINLLENVEMERLLKNEIEDEE